MKKFSLTVFFTFYHIFAPFILLNCSATDEPYTVSATEMTPTSDADALAQCESQTVLTQDCVSLIQSADEKANADKEAIATAYADIAAFIGCEGMTDTTTATTVAKVSTTCTTVITEMSDGDTACQDATTTSYTCDQIETIFTDATQKCTDGDASVSIVFCGEIG